MMAGALRPPSLFMLLRVKQPSTRDEIASLAKKLVRHDLHF
jgi:hypothetical protein